MVANQSLRNIWIAYLRSTLTVLYLQALSSNRFVAKIKLGKCLFAVENPFGKRIQGTV